MSLASWKSSLYSYLEGYLEPLVFPDKVKWMKLVTERIHNADSIAWRESISAKPALTHFSQLHTKLEPLYHWQIVNENPYHREIITIMLNLLCGNIPATIMCAVLDEEEYYKCNHCGKRICDIGKHFVMGCPETN